MSSITVNFIGICTHMNWTSTEPRVTHKTVLVNAWQGGEIDMKVISPHMAVLRVLLADLLPGSPAPPEKDGDVGVYPLHGVFLSIEDAQGDFQCETSYSTCVPSLEKLTPMIGRPSAAVVEGHEAGDVAAYVMTTSGRMHGGRTDSGAAVAWWMVEAGTTDHVTILMTAFNDTNELKVMVRDASTVTVANIGDKNLDRLEDFLLHYKTAAVLPGDPGLPGNPSSSCKVIPRHVTIPQYLTIGPGCSNSAYP